MTGKQARQTRQYDKILKENMQAALPGMLRYVLGIEAVKTEAVTTSLQHTREREPDLLRKVKDNAGNSFVLHIEFQVSNDAAMAYRMAEYYIMLSRKYRLPVRQYVIYLSDTPMTMPDQLQLDYLQFRYSLQAIASVDYQLLLRAATAEGKIFALLGDFGKDKPAVAVRRIKNEVIAASHTELETKKYFRQLRVLAQLRNLVPEKAIIMDSIANIFLKEKDLLYQHGVDKGVIKARTEMIKNLLLSGMPATKISTSAKVPLSLVRQVKKSLQ